MSLSSDDEDPTDSGEKLSESAGSSAQHGQEANQPPHKGPAAKPEEILFSDNEGAGEAGKLPPGGGRPKRRLPESGKGAGAGSPAASAVAATA